MAIAFRATGTVNIANIGFTGSPRSVALPAGHVANDLLLLFVVCDDATGPGTPSGWTKLGQTVSPQPPSQDAYYAPPRTAVFWRIDNGSLGSTVDVSFNTSNWPTGDAFVIAFVAAYSGCDTTSPIGEWSAVHTTSFAASQNHPAITTTLANDWLLSYRASSSTVATSYTISGGTNVERVDVNDTFPELAALLADSNGALVAGAQTQRVSVASDIQDYGSALWSIAIRPAPAAGATVAQVQAEAAATGSAFNATVVAQDGTWDLCGVAGLPTYRWGIDWDGDGGVIQDTRLINDNPWATVDTAGWTATNGTLVRAVGEAPQVPQSFKLTSAAGSNPRFEANQEPVIGDHDYRLHGWLYAPSALGVNAQLQVNWFDSSHVYLSTSTLALALTPGVWQRFDGVITAPTAASFGAPLVSLAGTPGAGLVLHGWGPMLLDNSGSGAVSTPGPGDLFTNVVLSEGITWGYGRDQARQIATGQVATAAVSICNADETYSPENTLSPLYGDLDPARPMRGEVDFGGTTYPLFAGRVDDYTIHADYGDRTVDFTFVDDQMLLQGAKLSTEVYGSRRTGDLINLVLDLAGWTGGRDIDPGATVVAWWWAEGTDALAAITDLVKSEGPPSISYVDPDGTFVFRDRHHRLLRQNSKVAQATYASKALLDCAAPASTGLDFTAPFVYNHGARDIVNSVNFTVDTRRPDSAYTAVWTLDTPIVIPNGSAVDIEVTSSDPFLDAQDMVAGTDLIWTGAGAVVTSLLSRRSGAGLRITLSASGGQATVTTAQVRARSIPVVQTTKVVRQDTASITKHGERAYPDAVPWASPQDAYAIANMILLQYANRRPNVQMRVMSQNPRHYLEILARRISDRIHIKNAELGLDSDFFIERIEHTIARQNQTGQAPVHSVVFHCEKDLVVTSNPFTFDVRGRGFDQGVFDPIGADDPGTVFIFDDPVNGQFDLGQFGT